LAKAGHITGASKRNWASYHGAISGRVHDDELLRDLLTDPQTSGGLLVACHQDEVQAVLSTFAQHGAQAATIGRITPGAGLVNVA
jgi:selenide,water dikinase